MFSGIREAEEGCAVRVMWLPLAVNYCAIWHLALRKHGILNVCITTDLHIAAKLNIIISKSIMSMTFAMSYAQ